MTRLARMTTPFFLCLTVFAFLPRQTKQIECYVCSGKTGDHGGCAETAHSHFLTPCPTTGKRECCSITVNKASGGGYSYVRSCAAPCTDVGCCCTTGCNRHPHPEPRPPNLTPTSHSETKATATLICVLGGLFLALTL